MAIIEDGDQDQDQGQDQDQDQDYLTVEEWLSYAQAKQFPGVPLCQSLGAAAPNTGEFWVEFAYLLHREGLHWDAVDSWQNAVEVTDASASKFELLITAGEACWSNYHEENFDESSAIPFFSQAESIMPDEITPLLWIAYIQSSVGEEYESLPYIRRALTLNQGMDLDWNVIDEHPHADIPDPIDRFTHIDNSIVHCIVEWRELGEEYLNFGLNQDAVDAYVQAIRYSENPLDMIEHVALHLSEAGLFQNIKVSWGL